MAAAVLLLGLGFTAAGRADSYFYDAGGRLIGVLSQANGGSAQYRYDAAGNITSVTLQPSTAVTVLGFAPVSAPPETNVTISGTGFGTTSNTSVSFNGTAATVQSVSATSIVATVPAGATSGTISVTAPGGTATSEAVFTIAAAAAPTITGFSPALINPPAYIFNPSDPTAPPVWTPGTPVTVSGSNFISGSTKVYIDGRLATANNVSPTQLTLSPPVVGSGFISVVTPQGVATVTTPLVVTPYITPIGPGSSILGLIDKSEIDAEAMIPLGTPTQLSFQAAGHYVAAGFVATPPPGQTGPMRMVADISYANIAGAVGDPIYLIGPDGLQIFGQPQIIAGHVVFLYTLSPNLIYTLFVGNPGRVPESATVEVENVPANATTTVTPETSGGVATVTLGAYQGAAITFPPPDNGDPVSLITEEQGNLAQNPFVVSITAPAGLTQNYTNFPQAAPVGAPIVSGSIDFSGPRSVPQQGNYTITFQPQGAASGNAEFILYDVTPTQPGTLTPGSPSLLGNFIPGQSIQAAFSGIANQYGTLLTTASGGLANNCFTVTVRAPASGGTIYSSFQCAGSDFSGQVQLPLTGAYTVAVNPAWTGTGQATLTLQAPLTPITGSLTFPGSALFTMQQAGQTGSVEFTIASAQTVKIATSNITGMGSNCLLVSLIGFGAPAPLPLYDQCGQASQSLDGIALPAQTGGSNYTILLNPIGQWSGSGSVNVGAGTPLSGGTIPETGAPVATTVAAGGSGFSLTFQGTANTSVSLSTLPVWQGSATPKGPGNCYDVAIDDPTGAPIYDSASGVIPSCGSTNWSGVLNLQSTGQYAINFTPNTAAGGTIAQQLFLVPPSASATGTLNGPGVPLTLSGPGQTGVVTFTISQQQFSASPYIQASVGFAQAQPGASPGPTQGCYSVAVEQVLSGRNVTLSQDHACGTLYQGGVLPLPAAGTYEVAVTATNDYGTASVNVSSR